ncbi:MAG: hypothetical protein QOG86_613 [Thermoleophilaceae bacterium]|nr:hypothetical protein [Thermoleophilaceae bacterium]
MRKRRYLIGAAVLAASLVVVAVALAVTTRTYTQNFATKNFTTGKVTAPVKKPGVLAGTYFKERSEDPDNAEENNVPKQDAFVDDIFPTGMVLDQSVAASCHSTDDEIQHASKPCPKKSKVGVGHGILRANAAPSPDIVADIDAYNCKSKCAPSSSDSSIPKAKQLILFVNPHGANPVILRGIVQGKPGHQRLHVKVPVNCAFGTPPTCQGNPDVRIVEFELSINKVKKTVTKNGHKVTKPFIRTPKTCPSSGKWTFKILFHGRDGKDQSKKSKSPCKS